jgi:hypothetical protein
MRNAIGATAVLVAVTILSACYDNPTAPMRPRPPAPLMSVSGPIGTHPITVPPLNDIATHGAVRDEDTGLYLPDNSTSIIRVTGTITLALNSGYFPGGNATGDSQHPIAGQVVPPTGTIRNGVQKQELMVTYHLKGETFTPSLTPDPSDSTVYSFTYRTTQGGELLVSRSGVSDWQTCITNTYPPGLPPDCHTPTGTVGSYTVASYKMTGTQTISAERLDDDVTLTAVASTGAKGRSVTFTAIPLAPGGGVWSWAWTPDSTPGETVACSSAVNPCVNKVYEPGTMFVNYYVTSIGLVRHAKAHVSAVDCPTNDSLLDRPDFRKLFKQIYDSSGPTLPFTQRREYGGWLYLNPTTDTLIYKPWPTNGASPCSINPAPYDTTISPAWLVAAPHSHPVDSGTVVPPAVCPQAPLGGIVGRGPSNPDDNLAQSQLLPVYAVDSKTIYRTTGPGLHTEWPRVSACTIF